MPDVTQLFCQKCQRTKAIKNFYTSYRLDLYPTGYIDICKDCLTMHVDNFDPNTYLWILEAVDVPYMPDIWNEVLDKYAQDPTKLTGTTILGRYISRMKLKPNNVYRWKDNEYLQERKNEKIEQAMRLQGFDIQKIEEMKEQNKVDFTVTQPTLADFQDPSEFAPKDLSALRQVRDDYLESQRPSEVTLKDLGVELTDEDRRYLVLKWGRSYKPTEWVQLETLYNEMTESYDIQQAGHVDTLKMICKCSLKANQLLDAGDVEGAQKMIKTYDALMKSGKFTAAQNKAETEGDIDSIGDLVTMCERDGFIPRYYVDKPQDKIDRVLQDMQHYTRSLILDELNLGNLIETAVRNLEKEREAIAAAATLGDQAEDAEDDKLFDYDSDDYLTDEDLLEMKRFTEELEKENSDIFTNQAGGY